MATTKRKKILIADDNAEATKHLLNLFEKTNGVKDEYEALAAYDGAESVKMTEKHHPDLILLDIEMPVLNGFEVLEQIKARKIATRIVIVTGAEQNPDAVVRCMKGGACDYVYKPVTFDQLIQRINRCFITENTLNKNVSILSEKNAEALTSEIERLSQENAELRRKNAVLLGHEPSKQALRIKYALSGMTLVAIFVLSIFERVSALQTVGGFAVIIALSIIPWENVARFSAGGLGAKADIQMKAEPKKTQK
jgi:CheY-like chemotaxis protein